jgi:hypothetical protein
MTFVPRETSSALLWFGILVELVFVCNERKDSEGL